MDRTAAVLRAAGALGAVWVASNVLGDGLTGWWAVGGLAAGVVAIFTTRREST